MAMYDNGEVDVNVVLLAAAVVVVRHALDNGDNGNGGRGCALTMVMVHWCTRKSILWFVCLYLRITA